MYSNVKFSLPALFRGTKLGAAYQKSENDKDEEEREKRK